MKASEFPDKYGRFGAALTIAPPFNRGSSRPNRPLLQRSCRIALGKDDTTEGFHFQWSTTG